MLSPQKIGERHVPIAQNLTPFAVLMRGMLPRAVATIVDALGPAAKRAGAPPAQFAPEEPGT